MSILQCSIPFFTPSFSVFFHQRTQILSFLSFCLLSSFISPSIYLSNLSLAFFHYFSVNLSINLSLAFVHHFSIDLSIAVVITGPCERHEQTFFPVNIHGHSRRMQALKNSVQCTTVVLLHSNRLHRVVPWF